MLVLGLVCPVLSTVSRVLRPARHIVELTCQKNQTPNPTNVLGVFGLSIRTTERDLDDEFSRHGRVEQVTIVYDQRVSAPIRQQSIQLNFVRQSDRSRGFGFIKMATVEDAERCIKELNGLVRVFSQHVSITPNTRVYRT